MSSCTMRQTACSIFLPGCIDKQTVVRVLRILLNHPIIVVSAVRICITSHYRARHCKLMDMVLVSPTCLKQLLLPINLAVLVSYV